MELIRGLANLKDRHRNTVVSIGNFDGVHLGHQAVIKDLKARALAARLPSTLILFEPMPQEFLAPDKAPLRLTRFMEKWPLLVAAQVDRVLCLQFGRTLAVMPPGDFIAQVLVGSLGVRHVIVGDDFRFGKDRLGDFGFLRWAGVDGGYGVTSTPSLEAQGERVSSTRIRALLIEGQLRAASALLGRPYSLSGRVMHGERLGRGLGFPTANIALKRRVPPLSGIFVARVKGLPGGARHAAAYIGKRSAAGGEHWVLEVHLLGYEGDLYGRRLEVQFLHRLREDRHFDSLDALSGQMSKDVDATRAWLAKNVDPRKS